MSVYINRSQVSHKLRYSVERPSAIYPSVFLQIFSSQLFRWLSPAEPDPEITHLTELEAMGGIVVTVFTPENGRRFGMGVALVADQNAHFLRAPADRLRMEQVGQFTFLRKDYRIRLMRRLKSGASEPSPERALFPWLIKSAGRDDRRHWFLFLKC